MSDIEFSSEMDVELVDHMGSDKSVIQAAKVSTLNDQNETTDEYRFIKFLMHGRHMSPFEHCVATFRIDAPIFAWREFMRHRTLSFNESSGRYTEMRPKFYVTDEHRPLVQTGKAGEYTFVEGSDDQKESAQFYLEAASRSAWHAYQELLDNGVAKEVARMVLPVNIYSTAYVTGKLRNWLQFLSLRTHQENAMMFPSYPQLEIEMVADQIEDQLWELYHKTMTAWNNEGRVGL